MAQLKESTGVIGIDFNCPFQVLDGGLAFALGQVDAGELKMVLGAMCAQVL